MYKNNHTAPHSPRRAPRIHPARGGYSTLDTVRAYVRNSKKLLVFAAGILGGAVYIALGTPIAQADPHAMYYTTVGQQQLFFNVLAALDQADYVEPVTGSNSRAELLVKYTTAIKRQGGSSKEALEASRANLPAILTRPITLEGYDALTAEQLRDESLEITRRAGTGDLLLNVFCEAMGLQRCQHDAPNLQKRQFAFVTNPLQWAKYPVTHGVLSALLSGTEGYQTQRTKILASQKETFQPGQAYNPFIAELRSTLQAAGDTAATNRLEQDIMRTLFSYFPIPLAPNLYEGLEIDESGTVSLAVTPRTFSGTSTALAAAPGGQDYSRWYDSKAQQWLTYPPALKDGGAWGASTIKQVQEEAKVDGEVANLRLIPRAKPPEECTSGGPCPPPPADLPPDINTPLIPAIEVPAVAKIAQVNAGVQALADLNTNRTGVHVEAQQNPSGAVRLLPRQPGDVAGATTQADGAASAGRVLGEVAPQQGVLGPAEKYEPALYPQFENDIGHFLGTIKSSHVFDTGCGCGLESVVNDFGTVIMRRVNAFATGV